MDIVRSTGKVHIVHVKNLLHVQYDLDQTKTK